jgi:hypothetical protein
MKPVVEVWLNEEGGVEYAFVSGAVVFRVRQKDEDGDWGAEVATTRSTEKKYIDFESIGLSRSNP